MYRLLIIFVCTFAIVSTTSAAPRDRHSNSSRDTSVSSRSNADLPNQSNRPAANNNHGYSPKGVTQYQPGTQAKNSTERINSVSNRPTQASYTKTNPSSYRQASIGHTASNKTTHGTPRKFDNASYRPNIPATTSRPNSGNSYLKPKPESYPARYKSTKSSSIQVSYSPSPKSNISVSYAKSHYQPPRGYVPPTYRAGRYYYPSRPASSSHYFGYWSFNYEPNFCTRSIYFHYGLFPYIQVTRVEVVSAPSVVYVQEPLYTRGGVYYSTSKFAGLDEVLGDIRSSWISGRFDLVDQHIQSGRNIAVFIDGNYDYSVTSDDYLSMTHDAVGNLETESFVWDSVKGRTDGQVSAFGTHTYNASGDSHTVYVSYTLNKSGNRYFITEVGSSDIPLN